jgi:hypothetical protein
VSVPETNFISLSSSTASDFLPLSANITAILKCTKMVQVSDFRTEASPFFTQGPTIIGIEKQ